MTPSHRSFGCFLSVALALGCSGADAPPTVGPGSGGNAGTGSAGAGGKAGGASGGTSIDDASADGSATDAAWNDASEAPSDATIADGTSDVVVPPAPPTLSATGFFKSIGADGGLALGDGVRPYEPRYKLWSDGADKSRWFYLPPGTKIDNTNQDHWAFPMGAKFWKEFSINGKRIETRLVEHFGPGPNDYRYVTYWWKPTDAGTSPSDATAVPEDVAIQNANGTDHDVPFGEHCHRCHDPLNDHVLGFGAFQLTSPAAPATGLAGVTIKMLSDENLLAVPTPNGFEIPGPNATVRNALGYMHANCGNCHNTTQGVGIPDPKLVLRVLVGQKTAEETGAYTTALNVVVTKDDHMDVPLTYRIFGGDTEKSSVSYRMALRGMFDDIPAQDQMPPLATEHADMTGINAVNTWIKTLPPPADR